MHNCSRFKTVWQHIRVLFAGLVFVIAGLPAHAGVVSGVQLNSVRDNYHNDFPWSLGFSFQALEDITLVGLGYYDADADGLLESHPVTLWEASGLALAEANITSESRLQESFRWASVAPVLLRAGQWYIVSGFNSLDDYTWAPDDISWDARINFGCAYYGLGDTSAMPDQTWGCLGDGMIPGFFGPNFLLASADDTPPVDVPEPSLLMLFAAGLLAAVWGCKCRWPNLAGKAALLVCTLSVTIAASTAHALGVSGRATQGPAGSGGHVPLNGKYKRYAHETVAGTIQYDMIFDEDGNYLVPEGETLRWVWARNGAVLNQMQMTYIGGDNRCWSRSTGGHACGGPTGGLNQFMVFATMRCQPESKSATEYTLKLYRGQSLIGNYPFAMERFRMDTGPAMWSWPDTLKPKRYNEEKERGEKKPLSFQVKDDLGCGMNLEDVEITLQTHPVPKTNLHLHFTADDKGLGEFVPVPGFDAVLSVDNTKAEGKTNASGVFRIEYQGKHFAGQETATLRFRRPAQGGEPEQVQEASLSWDITLGNFITVDLLNHGWVFGARCGHGHENQYQQAQYLRADVWGPLRRGLDNFYFATGYGVNLNDASFPMGGAVDAIGGTCGLHLSHRAGIDVDINNKVKNGSRLLRKDVWRASFLWPQGFPQFAGIPLDKLLDDSMYSQGFCRVREEPIHYRYKERCSVK